MRSLYPTVLKNNALVQRPILAAKNKKVVGALKSTETNRGPGLTGGKRERFKSVIGKKNR